MIAQIARRYAGSHDDTGAYAILYSLLVVVVFAFAAMVVDIAQAREDRRGDRVLADNAALAGADHLSPLSGINAYQACQDTWAYLANDWNTSVPAGACTPFLPYQPLSGSCPANTINYPPVTVGTHTVTLAWPVPDDSEYMKKPDIKPGDQTQAIDTSVDGNSSANPNVPCQRLAVQISKSQGFSLATAFGASGVVVSDASVALNRLSQGTPRDIAALNVLNRHACNALLDKGQGSILVSKTQQPDGTLGPGIIAVESDPTSCHNDNAAITVQGTGKGWICADGPGSAGTLHPGYQCNGMGVIRSHALDPGGKGLASYPAANTALLAPVPTPEGGPHGWSPVTDLVGCSTLICSTSPNYIGEIDSTYGNGTPTGLPYAGLQSDASVQSMPFATLEPGDSLAAIGGIGTFDCKAASGDFYVPPGNWYVDCPDPNNQPGFQPTNGLAMFGGGTIVFAGSIQIGTNGQLSFNVPVNGDTVAAPTIPDLTNPTMTSPAPTGDALVYINGGTGQGALSVSGTYSLWAPRTFFYMADHTNGYVDFGSGGSGSTLLLSAPTAPSCATGDVACQSAAFKKLVLWSECSCTQVMGGQGNIYLRGTFFTPKSTFNFAGQATYASAAAQIWADKISMTGQGVINLQPDPNSSFSEPSSSSTLIR